MLNNREPDRPTLLHGEELKGIERWRRRSARVRARERIESFSFFLAVGLKAETSRGLRLLSAKVAKRVDFSFATGSSRRAVPKTLAKGTRNNICIRRNFDRERGRERDGQEERIVEKSPVGCYAGELSARKNNGSFNYRIDCAKFLSPAAILPFDPFFLLSHRTVPLLPRPVASFLYCLLFLLFQRP